MSWRKRDVKPIHVERRLEKLVSCPPSPGEIGFMSPKSSLHPDLPAPIPFKPLKLPKLLLCWFTETLRPFEARIVFSGRS